MCARGAREVAVYAEEGSSILYGAEEVGGDVGLKMGCSYVGGQGAESRIQEAGNQL